MILDLGWATRGGRRSLRGEVEILVLPFLEYYDERYFDHEITGSEYAGTRYLRSRTNEHLDSSSASFPSSSSCLGPSRSIFEHLNGHEPLIFRQIPVKVSAHLLLLATVKIGPPLSKPTPQVGHSLTTNDFMVYHPTIPRSH
jgi:hypothetical protein